MRIALDILHPAHVHFFRGLYAEMTARGHEVLVTARDKDRSTELLDLLDIPYEKISTAGRGALRQAIEFGSRTCRFIRRARRFRPDVLAGIMGPTIAVAGKCLRRPAWVFYDTEFATATNRWVYPLADKVITPDCYQAAVGDNHVTYPGYHELSYLHPSRFTPSGDRVRRAGLDPDSAYAVVRFVGWWATHDRHERGLTAEQKRRVVEELGRHCRVVISSEADVPDDLRDHLYTGPAHHMHDVLAHADLYYGESATMASESAVLGVPAVTIAKTGRGYTDDQQQRFGLVANFTDRQFAESLDQALQWISSPDRTRQWADPAHRQLLAEKIDVTGYMVRLFESQFGHGNGAALGVADRQGVETAQESLAADTPDLSAVPSAEANRH